MREYGIELTSFWSQHDDAFRLFKSRDLHPQIWYMFSDPKVENQAAKIQEAISRLTPIAEALQRAWLQARIGITTAAGPAYQRI